MQYPIKEMSLTELLDASISVIKDNFKLLVGIPFFLQFPFYLIINFISISNAQQMQARIEEMQTTASPNVAGMMLDLYGFLIIPVVILFLVMLPASYAAIIYAVSRCYLGKETTIGSAIKVGFQKLFPMLWTFIVYGFFTFWPIVVGAIVGGLVGAVTGMLPLFFVGYLAGIVFTIILALRYCLAPEIAIIEDATGLPSLGRSKVLTVGSKGKAFMLFFMVWVLSIIIASLGNFIPVPLLSAVIASLLGLITTVLGITASIVLYFSCRCKVENFDLTLLAQAVGEEVEESNEVDSDSDPEDEQEENSESLTY